MHLRLVAHLQGGPPACRGHALRAGRARSSVRSRAEFGKEMGCNRGGRGVCYRQSGRPNGIPDYFLGESARAGL